MFPRALQARPDLSAKVSGLEMEHASIWMLLDRVEGEIRRNEVVKAPKYVQEIYDILQAHNVQEEKDVYPVAGTDLHLLPSGCLMGGYAGSSAGRPPQALRLKPPPALPVT